MTSSLARSDTGRALFCARPTHPFANVIRQVFLNSGQVFSAGEALNIVWVSFRALNSRHSRVFCSVRPELIPRALAVPSCSVFRFYSGVKFFRVDM